MRVSTKITDYGTQKIELWDSTNHQPRMCKKKLGRYENVTGQKDARSCCPMTCCQVSETLPTIMNLISTLLVNLGKWRVGRCVGWWPSKEDSMFHAMTKRFSFWKEMESKPSSRALKSSWARPYCVKESEYKSNESANTISLDPNPKNMRRKPISWQILQNILSLYLTPPTLENLTWVRFSSLIINASCWWCSLNRQHHTVCLVILNSHVDRCLRISVHQLSPTPPVPAKSSHKFVKFVSLELAQMECGIVTRALD